MPTQGSADLCLAEVVFFAVPVCSRPAVSAILVGSHTLHTFLGALGLKEGRKGSMDALSMGWCVQHGWLLSWTVLSWSPLPFVYPGLSPRLLSRMLEATRLTEEKSGS